MMIKRLLFAVGLALLLGSQADAQTRSATFTLSWTDNSNNETGFKLYRKNADATFTQIGQVGANSVTFVAPPLVAVEGAQVCFAVSAFNTGGESAKAEGCGNIPTTVVTVLPLVMESTTMPEYGAITINVTKPVGATKATLVLDVFDPDYPNEGELFVNANGPIQLWGSAGVSANQNVVAIIEYDIPLAWLVDGVNKLRFSHLATLGYKINAASVRFDIALPGAPSALTIKVQ